MNDGMTYSFLSLSFLWCPLLSFSMDTNFLFLKSLFKNGDSDGEK